jgi:hypothetical protein
LLSIGKIVKAKMEVVTIVQTITTLVLEMNEYPIRVSRSKAPTIPSLITVMAERMEEKVKVRHPTTLEFLLYTNIRVTNIVVSANKSL